MDRSRLRGSLVALVTPFDEQGEIDLPALARLIDFHLHYGTDGLVVCGTTGEGATLTDAQFETVVTTTVKRVNGKIPVIAGTGSNNTAVAIVQTQKAEKLGADGALVVGPYYNKPTQDGYYKHFKIVAESVGIPIILYNVPGRTSGMIDWRTMLRLAAIPNIFGVKEASANFEQLTYLNMKRPDGFMIWSGDDILAVAQIPIGCDGVISVVANEVPDLFREMVHAALNGNFKQARELHLELYALMAINFVESNPIPVKCALKEMGLIAENFHLPLTAVEEVNRQRIKNILQDLKILPRGKNGDPGRYSEFIRKTGA